MAGPADMTGLKPLVPHEARGEDDDAELQSLVIDPECERPVRRTRARIAAVVGVPVLVLGAVSVAMAWRQPTSLLRGATLDTTEESELVYDGPMPTCSEGGANCILTGCCSGGLLCVVPISPEGAVPSRGECKEKAGDGEFPFARAYPKVNGKGDETWQKDGKTCHSRFVAPDPDPKPDKHNGVTLPDVCIRGMGEHHVFVLADWGGVYKDGAVLTADVTKAGTGWRQSVPGVDDDAQELVANQMGLRASSKSPDYIINAGNSFYGGVRSHCGPSPFLRADTGQWQHLFEDMYKGAGLDGKQWLGVLGYQDYGGSSFVAGWDQVIGYTWGGPGSTGRWMLPAQYYRAIVHYPGFTVEYYFVDTSNFQTQQMCVEGSNGDLDHCGSVGPTSASGCKEYFNGLWKAQNTWLDDHLKVSTAEWQIVVTNNAPWMGTWNWVHLSRTHGIDLIISGGKHAEEVHNVHDKFYIINDGWGNLPSDFMSSTPWIVTGGGGGATSLETPDGQGPVKYGFVDLTLSNSSIKVELISREGDVRKTSLVRKRLPAVPYPFYNGQLTPEEKERDKPLPNGCPRKQEFYAYRVQDDKNYPDENINAASLAGALWYIHHEVVIVCPRKFGMTRIRRMKVTMQNTCELYSSTQTNFGAFKAFDSARCHVDDCAETFSRYGFIVGCQHIPFNKGIFAAYCDKPHTACRYPHWYSFPGKCPSMDYKNKANPICQHEAGGACKNVTGARDCTYHIEQAGEVTFDELYESTGPSHNWAAFCAGRKEYNNQTDKGEGVSFWDGIYSPHKCIERYDKVQAKFREKYPDMPVELDQPHCDYFKSDPIGNFLYNTGSGYSRSADRNGYAR